MRELFAKGILDDSGRLRWVTSSDEDRLEQKEQGPSHWNDMESSKKDRWLGIGQLMWGWRADCNGNRDEQVDRLRPDCLTGNDSLGLAGTIGLSCLALAQKMILSWSIQQLSHYLTSGMETPFGCWGMLTVVVSDHLQLISFEALADRQLLGLASLGSHCHE